MLWVPSEAAGAGGLSLFANYNNDAADERRLRKEHEMEAMRKRSMDRFYRFFYREEDLESSQTLCLDDLQLADFASILAEVCHPIWSEDVNLQLRATTQIEKLTFTGREYLVQHGVVQRLVLFLGQDEVPNLQVEAAWALIKIICGTCGNYKAGSVKQAVPCFVRLLGSTTVDVSEQAVFALGIVADESRKYCDLVLNSGVLLPLLQQLKEHENMGKHEKLSMLRNLTWTLSIFCNGLSESYYMQVKPFLTTLKRLLHCVDVEVLINTCRAIYELTYAVRFRINPLIDAGLYPKLVEHLLHDSRRVQIPVLLTLALVTYKVSQIQTLIDNGVLGPLWTLLTEDRKDEDPKDGDKLIKRQVCIVICGIVNGNEREIQAVIEAKFFDHLVKLLDSPHEGLQVKAAEAIATATDRGSPKQIEYLVNVCNIINPICNLLSSPTLDKAEAFLKVLVNVLEAGTKGSSSNPYIDLIVKTGCEENIHKIWRGEIECQPDSNGAAPYILHLLGLYDEFGSSDIDLSEI